MNRLTRILDALVEGGVVGVLVFAPLPFGGVRPWSQAAIEAGVAVVAALWLLRMLSAGELVLHRHPAFWPAVLMAGVVAVQMLVPGQSASPYATGESARLYAAYLALLIVLSGYLSTRARILRLTWVMVGWGAVMALVGLVNYAPGSPTILWLPKSPDIHRLTATFFNPNHQALYFAICLFLTLGLMLRPRRREGGRPGMRSTSGVDGQGTGRLSLRVILAGLALVLATALTLTLSRGAIVSVLGGLAALLVLLAIDRNRSRLTLVVIGGLAVFTAFAVWVGMEPAAARFVGLAREPFGDLRWPIWEATLRMAVAAPMLGVGLGAYQDAFTPFRPPAVPLDRWVDFAHNDYLQLFAETGVVGLGLLGWALIGVGVFVVRRLVGRRDPLVKGLAMGAFCALVVAALHSLVDFGLHRPANALMVVAVGAVLPAIVTSRLHRTGESVDLPEWRLTLSRGTRFWGAGAVALSVVLVGVWLVRPGVADWKFQAVLARAGPFERAGGSVTLGEYAEARRDLEQAVRWDPANPRVQAVLAEVLDEMATRMWMGGVGEDGRRLSGESVVDRFQATDALFAGAHAAYQRSIERRPMAAAVHQDFGWFLGRVDRVRRAIRGTSASSADPGFDVLLRGDESLVQRGLSEIILGAQLDPNSALRHIVLAEYALTFELDEPTRRRMAADAFQRTLTIDPRLLPKVVDDLLAYHADQTLLLDAVPGNHTLRLELARQLEARERWSAARTAFEEAIALAAMPGQEVDARLAFGHALVRHAQHERALGQARQALVIDHGRPDVFVLLGDIYESRGQFSEAESAFTSAVTAVGGDTSRWASRYRARLASFLAARGQSERAVALWRQALKTTPNDPWLRLELAVTLEARGDGSGALLEYQTAASLGSGIGLLQWEVGRAMARAGHIREAIELYETAERLGLRSPDMQAELAELFARGGWPDRAADRYRRILASRPEHEGARRGLANLVAAGAIGR